MYNILLDIPNVLIILLFITLCFIKKLIPSWLAFLLFLFSFTPFFVNDLIFPASYMPDQFRYFDFVRQLRYLNFESEESHTVEWSSWIFALIPLPFVETIKSLGFFNRFLVSALIVWLYAYKGVRGFSLVFLITYPSFLLYSSMSLRDTLIFTLMLVSIIFYIDGKRISSLLIAFFLIPLKAQNFILMLVYMFLHEITQRNSFLNKHKYFATIGSVFLLFIFDEIIIEPLNIYRFAMYVEDGGDVDNIVRVNDVNDLIMLSVPGAFNFLVNPLPWEADNILQLIQSFENLVLVCILVYSFIYCYKRNSFVTLKWIAFLFISFVVYELVVS